MPTRLLLAVDASMPETTLNDCRELCTSFATFLGEPVLLASLESDVLDDLRAWTLMKTEGNGLEGIEPLAPIAASMSAAPFVYLEDGRPDWSAMWGSFCELALFGGPPHRGEDEALVATDGEAEAKADFDAMGEMKRGIWETTGLYAEAAEPGWMAVSCYSRKMAAWMCAAIILENVDSKCEDEILYVPASADFELKNQVKSVVTVVAKVNHYWQAHVAQQEALKANS